VSGLAEFPPKGLCKFSGPLLSSLDAWALALAAAATLAMTGFKLGMGATLVGCAGLGWIVRMAL
jgi:chromate transporter